MRKRTARKGWALLKEEYPTQMAKCDEFLKTTPEKRILGKVKALHGPLKGLMQYDVNGGNRIQYWVQKNPNLVNVEYAGRHP